MSRWRRPSRDGLPKVRRPKVRRRLKVSMRAIVLSVVLVASPALAQQQTPTMPPLSDYVPTFGTQSGPPGARPTAPTPSVSDAPVSTAPQAVPPTVDPAQVPEALDPLADLIAQSAQALDEETAETASAPAPRRRGRILPIPPPEPEAPTTPGAYMTTAQIYELRVKGSVAAAQNLQGPLDGSWKVTGADGTQLFALQIVDKAGGASELEGAWRDVRRPGSVGSTGLIDDLRQDGDLIIARFSPRGGDSAVLTLRRAGYEFWSGELYESGSSLAVQAERILPQAPPGYEAQGRGPYVWPPRVAASRPAPAAKAVCSTKGKKGKALKAAKAKCAAAAKKTKASAGKKGKAKATAARKGKGKATAAKSAKKKR
ncbi:hypothetical protein CA606_15940 [Caulobacter vibrioides]|uniref:Uncharacterized protein n=1 Tax=Caulobacter vibrioides TaxID=155892 RepID=A0A290MNP2_CAUVI|nr:hypothetical protein CA606_15940 [Caulobacter vibrioides]